MDKNPELIDEIKGIKNTILSAKFSPDGKNLIAAGVEGAIYFYKLNQPNYHYKVFAHDDVCYSLDYGEFRNTNIHFFLSASRDKTVKLWKINSIDKEIINQEFDPIIYRNSSTVRFVNICPLNSSIFCTGSDDKLIKIWSTAIPNKRLNTFTNHTNWIRCCKFSKKDSNLLASCGDDSTMRLFDLRINGFKGSILKTITTSRNRHFTNLDWYPLSEYFIAIASSNNMIRIFDLRKMTKIIQFYRSFNDSVNCLEFHRNGQYLLACSSDATSKLINVIEGRLFYTLKGHYKSIFNCTFNKEGDKFLTSGKDKSLKLWSFNLTDDVETSSIDNLSEIDERAYNNYLKWDNFEKDNLREDNLREDNFRRINKSLSNLNDLKDNSKRTTKLVNKDKLFYQNRSTNNLCSNQFRLNRMKDLNTNSHFNREIKSAIDKRLDEIDHKLTENVIDMGNKKNRTNLNKNLKNNSKHPFQRSSFQNLINLNNEAINEPPFNDNQNYLNQYEFEYLPINESAKSDKSIESKLNQTNDSFKLDCIFSQLNLLEDSLSNLERRLTILETKLI